MGENDLFILWSSAEREVALDTVFVYARNAKKNVWFEDVELCIWGPSVKLAADDEEIQVNLSYMKEIGVDLTSCRSCAENYDLVDRLEQIGVDVRYMGKLLTGKLKDGTKVLTF